MKKAKIACIVTLVLALVFAAIGFGVVTSREATSGDTNDSNYYVEMADSYYDNCDYRLALVCYEKALELDPSSVGALHGTALTNNALGDVELAVENYASLVELDPTNVDYQMEWINAQISAGRYQEAKTALEKLIETHSDDKVNALYQQMHVESPKADLPSGSYSDYQILRIETGENSRVYYTTDGSEPSIKSNILNDYIVISYPNTTIKAKSINYLGYESETIELHYTITAETREVLKKNDSSTANAIRAALNKGSEQTIYNYEVAQITELYVVGDGTISANEGVYFFSNSYESMYTGELLRTRGTGDMSLLQYTPFLKTLVICWQKNVSLGQLSNLENLENLSLINNQITNISELGACANLKKLALGWNKIKDISSLAQLTELESLGLWNNQIENIDAVASLTKLEYLDIANNNVSDISSVSNLVYLVELWANGNEIEFVEKLDPQGNLRVLMISDNPLKDMMEWKEEHPGIKRCDWEA